MWPSTLVVGEDTASCLLPSWADAGRALTACRMPPARRNSGVCYRVRQALPPRVCCLWLVYCTRNMPALIGASHWPMFIQSFESVSVRDAQQWTAMKGWSLGLQRVARETRSVVYGPPLREIAGARAIDVGVDTAACPERKRSAACQGRLPDSVASKMGRWRVGEAG